MPIVLKCCSPCHAGVPLKFQSCIARFRIALLLLCPAAPSQGPLPPGLLHSLTLSVHFMAATLQHLGPMPDDVKHMLADAALQALLLVVLEVRPEATLPLPLLSSTAASPAVAARSAAAEQAPVQQQHPRRHTARQHPARGGQQQQGRRHGSSSMNSCNSSFPQQVAGQEGRLQALDTLGLMVGCMTALQRTQHLLSQVCPNHGEICVSCCSHCMLSKHTGTRQ
jgi:hypothetical protein